MLAPLEQNPLAKRKKWARQDDTAAQHDKGCDSAMYTRACWCAPVYIALERRQVVGRHAMLHDACYNRHVPHTPAGQLQLALCLRAVQYGARVQETRVLHL